MKKIIVLYHANCSDGFSGAWAAWKKFKNKADYISVDPQILPDKKITNCMVYAIDSSYPEKAIKKLQTQNNYVVIIDHHISAEQDAKTANEYLFDNDHSGSALAWKYFHGKKPLPQLLKHVEDFDLWRFRIPYTKEVAACLEVAEQKFPHWDKLVRDFENSKRRKQYIDKGKTIVLYREEIKKKIINRALTVKFYGYKTLAVNSSIMTSEIGAELRKILPPIAIVWYVAKDKIRISLRSNGAVDVSKLAKRFGGGGHHDASGFSLSLGSKFPWKVIKK